MGEKLRMARERIADFAVRDIRGRVAHLLLTFLERDGLIAIDGKDVFLADIEALRKVLPILDGRRRTSSSADGVEDGARSTAQTGSRECFVHPGELGAATLGDRGTGGVVHAQAMALRERRGDTELVAGGG